MGWGGIVGYSKPFYKRSLQAMGWGGIVGYSKPFYYQKKPTSILNSDII